MSQERAESGRSDTEEDLAMTQTLRLKQDRRNDK